MASFCERHLLLLHRFASSVPSNLPSISFSKKSAMNSFFSSLKLRRISVYFSRVEGCLRKWMEKTNSRNNTTYLTVRNSRDESNILVLIMARDHKIPEFRTQRWYWRGLWMLRSLQSSLLTHRGISSSSLDELTWNEVYIRDPAGAQCLNRVRWHPFLAEHRREGSSLR